MNINLDDSITHTLEEANLIADDLDSQKEYQSEIEQAPLDLRDLVYEMKLESEKEQKRSHHLGIVELILSALTLIASAASLIVTLLVEK